MRCSVPRVTGILVGWFVLKLLFRVLDDLALGRIPNVPAEIGIRAERQHNKAGLLRKDAIAATASMVAVALLRGRAARRKRRARGIP